MYVRVTNDYRSNINRERRIFICDRFAKCLKTNKKKGGKSFSWLVPFTAKFVQRLRQCTQCTRMRASHIMECLCSRKKRAVKRDVYVPNMA